MIKHLDGVCHVYLDDSADPEMAVRIADNAKTQRYGTCNTMETLLVAEGIAAKVLPRIASIYKSKNVEMRADEKTRHLVPEAKAATEKDYYTEWLAPIVSIRVVKGLDEAIEHIAKYGSQHTDALVAGDRACAERFLREVDSSSVMWNASTRFADGYEYGLGAEVGISTDKLHARGDRKSTRLNSSHSQIPYAVFCLKKKKRQTLVIVQPFVLPAVPLTLIPSIVAQGIASQLSLDFGKTP